MKKITAAMICIAEILFMIGGTAACAVKDGSAAPRQETVQPNETRQETVQLNDTQQQTAVQPIEAQQTTAQPNTKPNKTQVDRSALKMQKMRRLQMRAFLPQMWFIQKKSWITKTALWYMILNFMQIR